MALHIDYYASLNSPWTHMGAALDRGVFGAPSYVIGDDIFWGQDRLDFVERRLARG
jgi:2-hydroxychromene-2-carboxylate isomerase